MFLSPDEWSLVHNYPFISVFVLFPPPEVERKKKRKKKKSQYASLQFLKLIQSAV